MTRLDALLAGEVGTPVPGSDFALVLDALRAGRLRVVLADHEPPALPIQLVYPEARLYTTSLRAFVDLTVRTRAWRFDALEPEAQARA